MKKLLLLCLMINIGYQQIRAQPPGSITIKVKVRNQESKQVKIQGLDMITKGSIKINSKGLGSKTLNLNKGVYYLNYGDDREKIYLVPGGMFNISFDAQNIPKSIKFKGKGAIESSYLIEKDTNDYNAVLLRTYLLEEEDFLKTTDSIKQSNLSRLASYESNLNKDFLKWAEGEIKYQHLFNIQRYSMLRKFKGGFKDFEVSESYPDVLNNLNLDEAELSDIFYYTNLIQSYIREKNRKEGEENDSTDLKYAFLLKLDETVQNSKVKSQVSYRQALHYMTKTEVPELFMEKIRDLMTDSIQLNYIEDIFRKIILTQKGKPSPGFSFKNKNGEMIALSDLKGNVVYLDIWATWCVPCKKELPYLDSLQNDYANKNIAFVSIAWEDNKVRWRNFIEEKEIRGIQLFADNSDAPFFIDYSVRGSGIPRFILLDQNLNILDATAKRPSDESLRKQLDELLNE